MRRLDTIFSAIAVHRPDVDFPNVGSNSTVSVDVPMVGAVLGTHIISWTPLTDATDIEDLIIQFLVVTDDEVRITLQNPTGGAIDPGVITLEILFGQIRAVIDP